MLGFLNKRKTNTVINVAAPIDGVLIRLSDVSDPIFAQGMIGDGFAIVPNATSNIIYSPVSGRVASFPETQQAVWIETKYQTKVLIHVGVDTIDLMGSGFKAFVKQNSKVDRGDKLLCFSQQLMSRSGLDSTIMVIFSGKEKKELLVDYGSPVDKGQVLMQQWVNQ